MWEWLGKLTVLFAVLGGLYGFYARFIKPRTLKTKLRKLTDMVTDWFDEIDCKLEADLNLAALNNKEKKIKDFIESNLKTYRISPSPMVIRAWNQKMGLKEECRDSPELFQKYSRVPSEGLTMSMFFQMLVANFWKFHGEYSSEHKKIGSMVKKTTSASVIPGDISYFVDKQEVQRPEYNFAEIEMPVKFLRFYVEALGYG